MRCKNNTISMAWLDTKQFIATLSAIKNHYRPRFFFWELKKRQLFPLDTWGRIERWEKSLKRIFFCKLIIKLKTSSIDDLLENVKLVNCPQFPKSICYIFFSRFTRHQTFTCKVSPSLNVSRDSLKQFKYSSTKRSVYRRRAEDACLEGNKRPWGE